VGCGSLEALTPILGACGWKRPPSLVERLTLAMRQRVAAGGRRGNTLGQSEDGVPPHLALCHVSHNCGLPHPRLRQPL
jgi:hypothetical protein